MEHTVQLDPALGACVITVTGTHRRPQDSLELLRIAGRQAQEQGCSRFLFDMRAANIVGDALGAYETPQDPEKHGVSKHFRVAAVYSTITEDEGLLETAGKNRGAVAFRVFDDLAAARQWLAGA
jgi:hypothetical protein